MSIDKEETLLIFRIAGIPFAVPAQSVGSILMPPSHITHTPGSNRSTPGIFHHAEFTYAIVDLHERFGIDTPRLGQGRLLLHEEGIRHFAFLVDTVVGLVRSEQGEWANLPDYLPQELFSVGFLYQNEIVLCSELSLLRNMHDVEPLRRHFEQQRAQQGKTTVDDGVGDKTTPSVESEVTDRATKAVSQSEPPTKPSIPKEEASAPPSKSSIPNEDTSAPPPKPSMPKEDTSAPPPKPSIPKEEASAPPTKPSMPNEDTPAPPPKSSIPNEDTSAPPPKPSMPKEEAVTPTSAPSIAEGKGATPPPTPSTHKKEAAFQSAHTESAVDNRNTTRQQATPEKERPPRRTEQAGPPPHAPILSTHDAPISGKASSKPAAPEQDNTTLWLFLFLLLLLAIPLAYWFWPEPTREQQRLPLPATPAPPPVAVTEEPATDVPLQISKDEDGTINLIIDRNAIANAPLPPAKEEPVVATDESIVNVVADEKAAPSDQTDIVAENEPTDVAQPEACDCTHIVVKGDTLWDIAEQYTGNAFNYPELAKRSGIKNPHRIYPGDRVRIIIR